MKNFSKPVSVIALVAQIALWAATALMLAAFVFTFVEPSVASIPAIGSAAASGDLSVLGLTVGEVNGDVAPLRGVLLYGFFGLGFCAMIARNITLISRSLAKDAAYGAENSPFAPDNVRMVREIGIFAILIVVFGIVASVALRVVSPAVEASVSFDGLLLGLVVLYLSTIFSYGHELENEVEGLV